jgi:SAM-dependent methyltransferase
MRSAHTPGQCANSNDPRMDVDATLAAVRRRYEEWLAEHGPDSPRAVGIADPALQAVRFDALALVMEGEAPVSVADFGCGTGALFTHLAGRTAPPPVGAYTGYDLVPAMVEAARAAIDDPRARFVVASEVAEDADYVLASGALSIRPGVGDEAWAEHLRDVLRGLWARARRGLAFNLLPRATDPDVFVADPEEWERFCLRELPDSRVALLQGPPLVDFSVLVRRQ